MLNPQVESTNSQLKDITERFNTNFDIGIIVFLFNKSKYIIACFFLFSFFIAFIYLRYSQPIYESKALVQIDDGNRADNILKLDDINSDDDVIAKAIEQIRSKIFLKRVVEKLDISVNYFSEGTFKNNELYKASPYLVKLNLKKGNIIGQKIYVELNDALDGGTLNVGGKVYPFKDNVWLRANDFDINVYINQNIDKQLVRQLIKDNKAFYFTVSDVDAETAELQSKLDVRLASGTAKTILIKVSDVNSAKSTDIVNAITEEYLTYDVEHKSESSTNILSFIDAQLGVVYDKLKDTEDDLQRFKKEKNFGNNDKFLSSDLARFSSIEDQMLKIEMEEKIISDVQANIARNKSIDIYQLVSLVSGSDYEGSVKDITQNIQRLLLEKENLLYAVTPNSENIKQINYQLENQKRLLLESLEAVKLKYKTKYKSLLEKSSDFKSRLAEHPENEVEFSRLSRLYSISEKYYTMLLEKKTEFSISKAGYVSKNIILEKALGLGVLVSPNKKNAIIISLLVSVLLSALLVFIRYLFHDKIYSLNDITKFSSGEVALLGVIP
ncbi:MAG: Wzz/FepE/Etk N-terminal domain-containing protein, partial [Bacteroidota bacterium]